MKIDKVYALDSPGEIKTYTDCANKFTGPLSPTQILVFDAQGCEAVSKSSMRGIAQGIRNWLEQKAMNLDKWAEEEAWATAYKKTLRYFLNQFAYDTATYIATGGEGQKPMFYTEGWGEYLKNTADNAAGVFLETLSKEGSIKFNLCEPDFNVRIKIGLGLLKAQKQDKPECTFSKMKANWEKELQGPNFLNNFQAMFNPWENDLGIALSLQTGIEAEKTKKSTAALEERIEGDGFKPVKDAINNFIKTPGNLVGGQARQVINEQTEWEKVHTGSIFADAIDVFINTLSGKLLDTWFKKGLVSNKEDNTYNWDKLSFESGGSSSGGIKGAKERFRKLIEPEFGVRGDYNILAELTQCPNPNKAGPTNCVITDNFRQAIISKLTVGEAMKQGYLNANGIFGFTADGLEPSYNEGYPYRSMIILRKFRILPVGWEVAAQYIKQNPSAISGTKNLKDLVDCFDADDDYAGYNALWCSGLVDPNWVLKAPLNYCKREGAGSEITNEQIVGSGADSEVSVSRNSNYCADEQSCIKEYDDGSCQLYGYCTEEKRKWAFEGKSCEPKYNTCQTFRSPDGKTSSYLENTLDFSDCSVANAGCNSYCEDYNFTDGKWDCTLSAGEKIYFDRDAEECAAEDEGCHEFIRTKPGLGANLITNPSFEDDVDENGITDGWEAYPDGSASDAVVRELSNDSIDGVHSQKFVSGLNQNTGNAFGGITRTYNISQTVGEYYTVSFYAKKGAGTNNNIRFSHQSAGGETCLSLDSEITLDWQRYSKTCLLDKIGNRMYFYNFAPSEEFFIDALKIERGVGTAYDDYRDSGLVYEKLAPDYLACDGINDPAECDKYVRQCSARDEGCELYASKTKDLSVPAKVTADDYCPGECVGYDIYVQKPSVFDSAKDAYFIPKTAKTCSAKALGCDQFTNLDTVARGGEGLEYYSYLRQCIKPTDAGASCNDFYVWEGSDETGYQLRVFKMNEDRGDINGDGNLTEPATVENDISACDSNIYNYPSSHPAYNSDCREFYNRGGQVSYHLMSRTISCSEGCKSFRRTEKNIDPALDISTCQAGGDGTSQYLNTKGGQFKWDAVQGCNFCKNGGEWNDQHNACLYDAIPGEGQTCSAAEFGCREYAGNIGNNMRIIFSSNFEGSAEGWEGFATANTTTNLSSNSLMVGGNSLKVSAPVGGAMVAQYTIGQVITTGRSYVLSFVAKAEGGATNLKASFVNSGNASIAEFNGTADLVVSDWRYFEFNLPELSHQPDSEEVLLIGADSFMNFYIDDIKLTEITDKYYLIKNSWATPATCLNDIFGNPVGALYNLGCDEYADRENNTHYLHSFNHLCQESAVGCELVIDTHNYSGNNEGIWNDKNGNDACEADEPDCVEAPADSYAYVVYDKNKECSSSNKGCQFLGETHKYEGNALFTNSYLKNDPDKYDAALCRASAVGCDEWASTEGSSYFKDPEDQACEWRQGFGQTSESWGWYKKKINRCDNSGNGNIETSETTICYDGDNCSAGASCILDNNDRECSVDDKNKVKTFGLGGLSGVTLQPISDDDGYWAGSCPAAQSGCGEYIDPVSKFSENILYNDDFSLDVDNNSIPDYWSAQNNGKQNITSDIEPYTLYILSATGNNSIKVENLNNAGSPLPSLVAFSPSSNGLFNYVSSVSVTPTGDRESVMFYTTGEIQNIIVTAQYASSLPQKRVEIKKAAISYQLENEVDKNSCNGVVNFEDGCVLFNERTQNGAVRSSLIWDANLTYDDGQGISPLPGAINKNNANAIIKVRPDRVCDKWLACRSIVATKNEQGEEKNVCFDIGLCDRVDDNGDCDNFIIENKEEQSVNLSGNKNQYANISGYSKVGLKDIADNSMKGNYSLGMMSQEGEVVNFSNGNFEISGENGYPIGWRWADGSWNENAFKIIDNPYAAQTEGIGRAPEGRNFIKIGTIAEATSEFIDVLEDTPYILTAYINTINLTKGTARIKVKQYNSSGAEISSADVIVYNNGNDWNFQLGGFTTGHSTTRIKLTLYSDSDTVGNFYFDDIKIKPTLESRNNWNTAQSCRLYPEDDSLSCEYFDDSGIIKKGWLGYCLEYDRYPGSSDNCILWYPVDKVKGEGIEEGAGYIGKAPVYYCTEGDREVWTTGQTKLIDRTQSMAGDRSKFPPPYNSDTCNGDVIGACGSCPNSLSKYGVNNNSILPVGKSWVQADIIDITDPNHPTNEGDFAFTMKCELEVVNDVYCKEVVQTVGSVGNNKFWSGRTYEGSDYLIDCNEKISNYTTGLPVSCIYSTADAPFGSIIPPYPDSNPYEWDSDSAVTGLQALKYNYDNSIYKNVNMGQEQDAERLKRIFAQSYGGWQWTGNQSDGRYMETGGLDWQPPFALCNNTGTGQRPAYVAGSSADVCSILPKIDKANIKVNNETGNVIIKKNQFIHLTFNTEVDSEQLPMVMHAIGWGDNEKTVVSGVEMHSRPNADNPHSLYHSYNYWNLKSKHSVDQTRSGKKNEIYCGTAGANMAANNTGQILNIGSVQKNNFCAVRPKIKIKDNWGWCNSGVDETTGNDENPTGINDCNQWEEFGGLIIVSES